MKRFGRYLLAEILPLFAAALVALVLLLMLVAMLGVLADVLARGVSPALVARYMLFKLPAAIGPGLPLALLFATLLALTRLGQDGEIKAALVLGVNPLRFVVPVLGLGLLVSALTFANNELLVPYSEARAAEVERDILLLSPETVLQEGAFFSDALGRNIFIGDIQPGGRFNDIIVVTPGNSQGPRELIRAASGQAVPERGVWLLEDIRFQSFREASLTLDITAEEAVLPVRGLTARASTVTDLVYLPLGELLTRIRNAGNDSMPAELTALHRKFAEPLAATAFALFALALGLFTFRSGASIGFVAALLLTFVYYATWSVTKLLGAQGTLAPAIAGWLPVALYAAGGLVLLVASWRR
ncbi:MAG TPA: LptF/LptG family permease [Trueperaceae bacterium]|nr:LptF/LptG family permease [Trueperaceae bacterium]